MRLPIQTTSTVSPSLDNMIKPIKHMKSGEESGTYGTKCQIGLLTLLWSKDLKGKNHFGNSRT
jgi:hypothetical protein